MAGELSTKDKAKLEKKINESLEKIAKIGNKNQGLMKLKQKHFGMGLKTIKETEDLPGKIELINAFKKEASANLTKLHVQARESSHPNPTIKNQIKQYEYIKAVADSIENKRDQLKFKNTLKPETARTKSEKKTFKAYHGGIINKAIKDTKKNEQKQNKTIKNFEIKDDPVKYAKAQSKEIGQRLNKSMAGKVASNLVNTISKKIGIAKKNQGQGRT